jgi:hypothetical protein
MSKSFQGYRRKMVWKTTEDLEQIQGPQGSVVKCDHCNSQESPQYTIPTMIDLTLEGLSPLSFLT